ncbi:MAG: DUF456 family protein [bacterium]
MAILEVFGYILFWLVMIVGILIIPFGIPGTFVILANAVVFGWLTDFADLTWKFLGLLFLISVTVEVIEFFLGAAAAGKYGASKTGMFGAILGGFLGAIMGTTIVPLLGTLLGAFAGAFVGAALFEYAVTKDFDKSLRVGFGAFLGSLGGKLTKIAAAITMVIMVWVRIF